MGTLRSAQPALEQSSGHHDGQVLGEGMGVSATPAGTQPWKWGFSDSPFRVLSWKGFPGDRPLCPACPPIYLSLLGIIISHHCWLVSLFMCDCWASYWVFSRTMCYGLDLKYPPKSPPKPGEVAG